MSDGVDAFNLSPGGLSLLALEGRHDGKLFDTGTGRLIQTVTIPDSSDLSTAGAFSPAGTRLAILRPGPDAAGEGGQEILLLKPEDGSIVRRIPLPESSTFDSVQFSPDGTTLIAYQPTRAQVMAWSVADGVLSCSLSDSDSNLLDLAMSVDGRLAVLGISESGSTLLRVWDLATGIEVRHVELEGRHFYGTLTYSEDGKYLAASVMDGDDRNDSYVRLWSTSDWTVRGQIDTTNATVHFSPDSGRLAVTEQSVSGQFSGSSCVTFWQVEPFQRLDQAIHLDGRGQCFGFARDGKSVFMTRGTPLTSHQLCEVDIESKQIVRKHNIAVRFQLARSADGNPLVAELAAPNLPSLISGAPSTKLKVSSFGGLPDVREVRLCNETIETMHFSECSQQFVATTRAECAVYDLQTGQSIKFPIRGGRVAPVIGHRVLYLSPDGRPALFNLDNNESLRLVTSGVSVEPDEDWHTVWGSGNCSVIYADINGGLYGATVESQTLVVGDHIADLGVNYQVAVSPDGTRVAVQNQSRDGRPTDTAIYTRGGSGKVHRLPSQGNSLAALAFSHDNLRLFTLQPFESSVEIWKHDTSRRVLTLGRTGEFLPPTEMAESVDGRVLALAGSIPEIHLWDPQVNTELGSLDSRGIVSCMAFAPDSSMLAAARVDGSVALYRGKP